MVGLNQDSNLPARVGASSLSVREIVFMLFRRRWIVLAVSIPIIVVGGLSLFRQTGSFTAASRVLVEFTKVDLPRWNTQGRNIDFDRELSTMFNIAMSLPVADMAAASLQDSLPVIKQLLPARVNIDQPGALRDFLLEKQDVSAVGESNILEFRFSSAKPRVSLMCVGALRNAFVNYQVHGRRNVDAIAYYNEQLINVQGEVDSLLTERSRILEETGYSSIVDQMRNEVGQMADLEGKLLEATAARRALEMEHASLKKFLDGDPLAFPIGLDESRSHSLVFLRNQVSKHQDVLNSILATHTAESIPARRQQSIVAASLERLRTEEEAYVESIRLQAVAARGREQTLREQVAVLKKSTSRGPEAESRISMVDIELESLRQLMKDIQGKLGEVRLSQMADERVSSVTSLTEPEIMLVLSGSKTMVYFIMISLFALALGIVVALILESMDHRVYHPKDVEENLKLPVYASVTRTD